MGIALQQQGVDFLILEKADEIGGTWRDNTYPGCAPATYRRTCTRSPLRRRRTGDTCSLTSPRSSTTSRASPTSTGCAATSGSTPMSTRAHWDDDEYRWHVFTESGQEYVAQFVISGAGGLHIPFIARYPRPRRLPRTGLPHRSVEPRRRLDRETGRGDRHRRQCHPGRARTGEDRRPGAAVPAHGRLDQAPDQLRRSRVRCDARSRWFPGCVRHCERRSYWILGQQGGRAGKATATDEGRRVDVQGEHPALHQRSGTAGQADTALPRRLQANPLSPTTSIKPSPTRRPS